MALVFIAVGGSIIKPTISGTVTRTTEEGSTRPVGFGLYYTMINAGGLIGPVIAAQVRNRAEFRYVFWVSAAACALMLVQALTAFSEPVSVEDRTAGKSIAKVFAEIVMVLANWRFVLLLVIFSGFWGMINVLFGFMPLYVETFTDLSGAGSRHRPGRADLELGWTLAQSRGLHLDGRPAHRALPGLVSYLTSSWKTISAMLVGTTIATASWILPAISPAAGLVASASLSGLSAR